MSTQGAVPVLAYATPDARDAVPFIEAMRARRRLAGWGFWLTIGGLLYLPAGLVGFVLLVVASTATLISMYQAARSEVGVGYAVRHLCLAVVLLSIAFLGVFLVTRLVEADLVNWRLPRRPAEEPRVQGG